MEKYALQKLIFSKSGMQFKKRLQKNESTTLIIIQQNRCCQLFILNDFNSFLPVLLQIAD